MKNTRIIFVYGTIKRNEPNHHEIFDRGAQFLDEAVTTDKWPLIIASNLNLPFLLYKSGIGKV